LRVVTLVFLPPQRLPSPLIFIVHISLAFLWPSSALHASAESLPSLGLALHLLADLDVDLEELGYAAVEADGLALVQIGFAVRCIDAFR
jgi:hypothetical protein